MDGKKYTCPPWAGDAVKVAWDAWTLEEQDNWLGSEAGLASVKRHNEMQRNHWCGAIQRLLRHEEPE